MALRRRSSSISRMCSLMSDIVARSGLLCSTTFSRWGLGGRGALFSTLRGTVTHARQTLLHAIVMRLHLLRQFAALLWCQDTRHVQHGLRHPLADLVVMCLHLQTQFFSRPRINLGLRPQVHGTLMEIFGLLWLVQRTQIITRLIRNRTNLLALLIRRFDIVEHAIQRSPPHQRHAHGAAMFGRMHACTAVLTHGTELTALGRDRANTQHNAGDTRSNQGTDNPRATRNLAHPSRRLAF